MKTRELIAALKKMPRNAEVVYCTHDADSDTWDGIIGDVAEASSELANTGVIRGFAHGIVVISV